MDRTKFSKILIKKAKKIKSSLIGSRFQSIAKFFYDFVINIELNLLFSIDSIKPAAPSEHSELLNELTIVIKTFER